MQELQERVKELNCIFELSKIIETKRGLVKTGWCGLETCEEAVKEKNATTIRAIIEDTEGKHKKCVVCGKDSRHTVLFAKAY